MKKRQRSVLLQIGLVVALLFSLATAIKRMLLREQIDDPETVTVSRVESLSGEEQRQFAGYCYLAAMSKLDRFRTELELTMLNCIQVTGPESAFPFFQAQREDVRLKTDTFCPLGEYWPFHLNLHPGVNEMLTEKANRVYYETVTSTMNGTEYVYAYVPILLDGEVRCTMYAPFIVTELKQSIWENTQRIEWVNILVLGLTAIALLALVFRTVLKPITLIQRSIRHYRGTMDSSEASNELENIRFTNEIGALAGDFIAMMVEIDNNTAEVARLMEAVTSGDTAPDTLLPHVREKIDAFVSGGEQFDDITMLALRYRGTNAL